MKLAYVTTYDSRRLSGQSSREWSGTGYYIAQSLKKQAIPLEYVGSLQDKLAGKAIGKFKRHYYQLHRKTYVKITEPWFLRDYANQVARKLSKIEADIVFSATPTPIAYLECKQPIVFWGDATFANLIDFYPQYSNLCQESIDNGHSMERKALQKAKLAIYASDWAAQTAIDYYQADPKKVKVVPFGANTDSGKTVDEIKDAIQSRPSNQCKLLFLGVEWFRKGGDVAFKVARELNNRGLNTQLTVVGCQPIVKDSLPSFVKPLGYISKSTKQGKEKISRLMAESHFLIVPSRAECFGVVFCEANSLGVPCLATKVGGIPTIIRDNINGHLFDLKATEQEYCDYIIRLFSQYNNYRQLATSCFNEYQSRLNWFVSGKLVKSSLESILN